MDCTSLPFSWRELRSHQRERLFKEAALVSVYEIFATIPDPRRRQGLRYELAYRLDLFGSGHALRTQFDVSGSRVVSG